MAISPKAPLVGSLALMFLVIGCAAMSSVASAIDALMPPGTLTVWTSDSSPGYVEVQVDSTTIGTLTAWVSNNPSCGIGSSAGVITMTFPSGHHVISAKKLNANGIWGPSDITIPSGGCLTFRLRP